MAHAGLRVGGEGERGAPVLDERRQYAEEGKGDANPDGSASPILAAGASTATVRASQADERSFANNSPWNVPIRQNPMLDAQSADKVAHLSQEGRGYASLYESGVPIFDADAFTPKARVKCTKPWGDCQLESGPVPIPSQAQPNSSTDAAMIVIDRSTGKVYEFWQARKINDRSWQTSWGGVVDIRGVGTPGQAVGSGVAALAGVVRIAEFMRGRIDHALVFTAYACPSEYRHPASKSDGSFPPPDCLPEGARIQLDPGIDVDSIPGITRGERIVARALQTYGAYAVDNGGARMAFKFERPTAGKPDPYREAGFPWDYWHMPHIPWNKLRVLNRWDGT